MAALAKPNDSLDVVENEFARFSLSHPMCDLVFGDNLLLSVQF
jgi:hypothetical protein